MTEQVGPVAGAGAGDSSAPAGRPGPAGVSPDAASSEAVTADAGAAVAEAHRREWAFVLAA
ncbi:MAG TPA: hypothetical protein VII59_17045, partial [Streptosporangiaceae bacterium]